MPAAALHKRCRRNSVSGTSVDRGQAAPRCSASQTAVVSRAPSSDRAPAVRDPGGHALRRPGRVALERRYVGLAPQLRVADLGGADRLGSSPLPISTIRSAARATRPLYEPKGRSASSSPCTTAAVTRAGASRARDDQLRQPVQPCRRPRSRPAAGQASIRGSVDRLAREPRPAHGFVGARSARRHQVQPRQHPKGRLPPDGQELAGLGGQPQRGADRPGLALGAEVACGGAPLPAPSRRRPARPNRARRAVPPPR